VEYEEIKKRVAYLEDLLANPRKITYLVRDELVELKRKFGDARRTEIVSDFAGEITDEDLVANEKVLITISGRGYVKRMPANTYKAQRRGGRGIIGQVLREEDALRHMVAANARDNILFFSDKGKVYQLKAWQIPSYDRTARGTPVINVINVEPGESITAILDAPDFENSYTLKLWCRTADRSALARKAWKGKAYGDLENITVMFDKAVDPGPPTADMFEKRLFGAPGARLDASPAAAAIPGAVTTGEPLAEPTTLPEIGRIGARDGDYRVVRVARDGDTIHLWLEPRTDAERNRLDEMWVDARTYDLRRARVRDHLYFGITGQSIEDDFDVLFTPGPGGLPLITSIHGATRYGQFETDYTFRDVTFPPELPEWYFQPKLYGAHRADAPA